MNKFKPYIIGAVMGVLIVVVLGGAAYVAYKKIKPLTGKIIAKLGEMKYSNVKKSAKELTIADFETPEDFKKFADSNAVVELSREFPSKGTYCAKVTFPKSRAPSFRIEKYFERDKSFANWAPYGSFLFDIYNPQDAPQRLILQIRDSGGEKVKRNIHLEPNAKETIEIEMGSLRHGLSIYRIAQINIFRWEPSESSVFYIDNLRLVPQGQVVRKSIFDAEFTGSQEQVYAKGDYFAFPAAKWTARDGKKQFYLHVVNPSNVRVSDFPCRGGVPFPRGELKSKDEVAVYDSTGKAVLFQARAMARWNDGSIKWLLLDMAATAEPGTLSKYIVSYPAGSKANIIEPLAVERGNNIVVDTGKIKFQVTQGHFRLFDKVWMRGKELLSADGDMSVVFRGVPYYSSLDKESKITIEENGPLVTTLKAEGWFVSRHQKKFCKFIVRIRAYKDESFVRVFHTFIYTGYPENKYHYLYKGMRLPKNETILEVSVDLRIPQVLNEAALTFAADSKVFQSRGAGENLLIFQSKDNAYRVIKNGKEAIGQGQQLEGWLDASAKDGMGVSVILRKLWQQHPKAFEIDPKTKALKIKLWPKEAGGLDLKTTERALGPESVARGSAYGLAKTHELVFYFHQGDYKNTDVRAMSLVLEHPPLIMANSQWMSDARILGALASYNESYIYFERYENCIERLFDWGFRQRNTFKWNGFVNFGDVLSDYGSGNIEAKTDEDGWYRDGRWGWFNCSVMGIHSGCFLQFLRTGKYKYFEFGEDMTRHVMDIDTCHFNITTQDRRVKRLPQDYSQVGSMHSHNADHWSGRNEVASYTNLNGILLYYYLTGNERALDVAKEVGEFFLKHPITYFRHSDIAPGRALANILWGEVALYEATGDERLKKDADYWADFLFKGQNRNGSWNEDYDPVSGKWKGDPHVMYMTGYIMQSLIEYHRMTANKAIGNSIVLLTDYLIKHDDYYPFFDGLSYSYFLTGDKKYLDNTEKWLEFFERSQRKSNDPLWNGMIFQKLTYTRLAYFLYSMPYAFEALLSQQGVDSVTNNE